MNKEKVICIISGHWDVLHEGKISSDNDPKYQETLVVDNSFELYGITWLWFAKYGGSAYDSKLFLPISDSTIESVIPESQYHEYELVETKQHEAI